MKYVWKRLTKEDVERLTVKYNLEPFERRIIELRREGKPLFLIANEIGYSLRSIERHSQRILETILKDI